MADLEIKNLHVRVEDREILKGVDLNVSQGEVHALMGPNGSGKSTLANTIMGHPGYEITDGQIAFRGEDITEAEPEDRAQAGLFLAFQYPAAIPGVSVANFLRMAINTQRDDPIGVVAVPKWPSYQRCTRAWLRISTGTGRSKLSGSKSMVLASAWK